MIALGQNLGADQKIDLVIVNPLDQLGSRLWSHDIIGCRNLDPDIGECFDRFFIQTLNPRPTGRKLAFFATGRAGIRCLCLITTMVTLQFAPCAVLHEPSGAVGALEPMTTSPAQGQRCITTPV